MYLAVESALNMFIKIKHMHMHTLLVRIDPRLQNYFRWETLNTSHLLALLYTATLYKASQFIFIKSINSFHTTPSVLQIDI